MQANRSIEKKEAKLRIAYLDIALPHRGIHGIIDILKNVAILYVDKSVKMPEFSVTSNIPSIMNGGLDFCDWSKNDKELALILKKPIEIVLGKYGSGLVNIALAESGFEKGSMEVYEVMTRSNTGFLMAETNGKLEMCFAATGVMVKVHMLKGQPQIAINLLTSFRKKLVKEEAVGMIPNLNTLLMWIELQKGNITAAKEWLATSPDENKEFYILNRYKYINKVRCLIATGNAYGAIGLVERLNVYFTEYERHYMNIENHILKAIILFKLNSPEWEDVLNEGLKLAEKYKFKWVIAQEGIAVKPLITKLKTPSVSDKYFKEIKAAVDQMAVYFPEYLKEEKVLKEPLTEMEKTIIKLMLKALSTKEICNFSYSTLKFHNRNIYRKLGVNSRKEAEAVVKKLGLEMI